MKLQLFIKSRVDAYTRADGAVVHAHDNGRAAAALKDRAHKLNGGKDWRDEENWHSQQQMKMRTHSEDELRYIHKDASEAAEIGERSGFDSKKTGQYRDQAHYASMEMRARRDGK